MGAAANTTDQVDGTESVLRRVLPAWHREVAGKARPPRWQDFKPTAQDHDGLSVTRRRFVKDLASIAQTEHTQQPRSLAECEVRAILARELSVVASPLPSNRGHALIPELNRHDYENNQDRKKQIKEHAVALANCARIVYEPDEPT